MGYNELKVGGIQKVDLSSPNLILFILSYHFHVFQLVTIRTMSRKRRRIMTGVIRRVCEIDKLGSIVLIAQSNFGNHVVSCIHLSNLINITLISFIINLIKKIIYLSDSERITNSISRNNYTNIGMWYFDNKAAIF